MQHVRRVITPANGVAFADQLVHACQRWRSHAQPGRLHIEMTIQFEIVGMHHHRRAGGLLQFLQPANVIDVGVRADDSAHCQRVFPQDVQHAFHLIARIEHQSLVRFWIAKNVAITLQRADRKDFVNELFAQFVD